MPSQERRTPYIAERFNARDSSGNTHTICYWKWHVELTMLNGRVVTTETGWKYETTDGRFINPTDDGHFEIAATRERLTRE